MGELITETRTKGKSVPSGVRPAEENNEQEMLECLARLKVWQVENLMAPNGMDKFV